MKTSLAALLLFAPLAVLAGSGEPTPVPADPLTGAEAGGPLSEPAPEAAAKAMSAAYVPRYHSRDSWFIGFGVGTGDATVYSGNSFATLRDLAGSDARIGALRFEVGLTLSDRLLLGVELSALGTQQDVAGETARVAVMNADAVLTWFPDGDGLFLRLGGGGTLLHHLSAGTTENFLGFNGLVGIGYAFWVGERFNLSIRLDHSRQRFEEGVGFDTSELWAGTIGFDWY